MLIPEHYYPTPMPNMTNHSPEQTTRNSIRPLIKLSTTDSLIHDNGSPVAITINKDCTVSVGCTDITFDAIRKIFKHVKHLLPSDDTFQWNTNLEFERSPDRECLIVYTNGTYGLFSPTQSFKHNNVIAWAYVPEYKFLYTKEDLKLATTIALKQQESAHIFRPAEIAKIIHEHNKKT